MAIFKEFNMKVNKSKDARKVLKKWSTWLATLGASMTAAAIPLQAAGLVPMWLSATISTLAILLIPVATSIAQWPENDDGTS